MVANRLLLAALLSLISFQAYTLEINLRGDIAVQYYPPSAGEIDTEKAWVIHRFEGSETTNHWLIPLEVKYAFTRIGESSFYLFGDGGISFYFEDSGLASINTSLGIGVNWSLDKEGLRALKGTYITLYPLCEFPVFAFGKTAIHPWKFAAEIGLAGDLLPLPIYISVYIRAVFFPTYTDAVIGSAPHGLGLTIGWLF
ncbi:hypothetical protein FACS1894147_06800 [Spirochaetia bacterium]|nr:hypothetical protein FACS1894147_06800 [Spirochaetia bacterium]